MVGRLLKKWSGQASLRRGHLGAERRVGLVAGWEEQVLGTGSSKRKSPEVGTCWVDSWNSEKMNMAGLE